MVTAGGGRQIRFEVSRGWFIVALARQLGLVIQPSGMGMVGRWAKRLVTGQKGGRERRGERRSSVKTRNWTDLLGILNQLALVVRGMGGGDLPFCESGECERD